MINGKSGLLRALSRDASAPAVTQDKAWPWFILVIFAVGAFYLLTIRGGHNWGDDFAMYIHHAQNLAEGRPYSDTGYIYNPGNIIGPTTYPPIYPLLLVPIYKLWGLNLKMMKVEVILIFLLALIAIYLAFRSELAWPYLVTLIALIGFHPLFWQFKDSIGSDLPFLLFTYLSFYFIHQALRFGRTRASQTIYALLTGLLICLAVGTRIIGLVLIPCLFVYYVIRSKRLGPLGIFILLLTAAIIYRLIKSSQIFNAYADHFGINALDVTLAHSRALIQAFALFWENGYNGVLWLPLFVTLTALAIVGYVMRISKKQITCFELFVPFYLGVFIVLPVSIEWRYVMPVIPLYIFFVFLGLDAIADVFVKQRRMVKACAFAGVLIAILVSYAGHYTRLDYGPIQQGMAKPETQQLFDYVKRETGQDEVVVFSKPRALTLLTGRAAATWHNVKQDKKLWDFFRQINASYLIVGRADIGIGSQTFIQNFAARNRARLQETFANADFCVYRIIKDST